jgi:putative ABC transport system permease protein
LGLRLVDGRDLTMSDAAGPRRVALINETAARRFWPGERAVGQRIRPDDGDDRVVEIIGVISDTRHFGLSQAPQPEFYLPTSQVADFVWRVTDRAMTIVLRTNAADPMTLVPALRAMVRQLDPELPVYAVRSMEEVVTVSTASARNFTGLLSTFGAIALALAAVGIYGLVAFLVQQRNHEFGVRVALGATAADIRRLVVGRGLVLGGIGVAIGTIGAVAGSRLLQSLLFQVSMTDPLVLASVGVLLLFVTTVACWIPASRAARVNPLLLLRDA